MVQEVTRLQNDNNELKRQNSQLQNELNSLKITTNNHKYDSKSMEDILQSNQMLQKELVQQKALLAGQNTQTNSIEKGVIDQNYREISE